MFIILVEGRSTQPGMLLEVQCGCQVLVHIRFFSRGGGWSVQVCLCVLVCVCVCMCARLRVHENVCGGGGGGGGSWRGYIINSGFFGASWLFGCYRP